MFCTVRILNIFIGEENEREVRVQKSQEYS